MDNPTKCLDNPTKCHTGGGYGPPRISDPQTAYCTPTWKQQLRRQRHREPNGKMVANRRGFSGGFYDVLHGECAISVDFIMA